MLSRKTSPRLPPHPLQSLRVNPPASASSTAATPAADISSAARRWVMFALLSGVAVASLDSAIANIALPTIAPRSGTTAAASV